MRTLSPQDVLKLVGNDELAKFCQAIGIDFTTLERQELANKLQSISRTKVLSALISINGIWLRMMRDIILFLESHSVAVRTTGCIFTLPINGNDALCELSPQVASLAASFETSSFTTNSVKDWEQAESKWEDELKHWVNDVFRKGEPYFRQKQRDIVEEYLESRTSGRAEMYEDVVEVNREKISCLFSLWRTLDYLAKKLAPLQETGSSTAGGRVAEEIIEMFDRFEREISRWMRDYYIRHEIQRYVENTTPWSDEESKSSDLFDDDIWTYDDIWEEWKLFVEDLLALASLDKSSDLTDLLSIDLLKDRPRLFELWCMCETLKSYSIMGCCTELLSLVLGDTPRWNLNYSRASEPVARIQSNGNEWWLFFQLFQKGAARAHMPDLALLAGPTADSEVLWIADPKYAEAGGYSLKAYMEVAERYRDAFSAKQVWICEFFDRRHWFGGACAEHGDRFSIVSEVQPDGEGRLIFHRELRQLHDFPLCKLVVAVDCSDSFVHTLSGIRVVLDNLLQMADTIVCFAGSARVITATTYKDLENAATTLTGGTVFHPLFVTLKSLPSRDQTATRLLVVSDSRFSDHSTGVQEDLLGLFAHVDAAGDYDALQKIAAALLPPGI